MSARIKILAGAVGIAAAVGFASPAAAQYYPQNNNGVLGAIIGALGGYGQYPYGNYGYGQTNDRYAVDQCARAVESRLNGYGGYGSYNQGYNQGYGGYNQGYGAYGNQYGGGRVTGITRVERRSGGGLKVYGVAQTNAYAGYNNGYGYNNGSGYNQGYGAGYPDIKFNCKVSTRGQITDVDIDRLRTYNRNDYYYGYRR